MNQILSVGNSPMNEKKIKNNSGPKDINSILKFFSIAILVFGIFMIGTGSYSMYQDSKSSASTKPSIFVEETSDTQLTLKVQHSTNLSKVTYNWNNGEEQQIETKGKKSVEQTIEIPTGTNILNVYAVDEKGLEGKYQKEYTLEGDININFEVVGSDLKITAEGKEDISYITYRWDEEDETKVDIDDTSAEQVIEIPKGLHTLTVVAVDINNNTETKEQEVNGVTKPKLDITTDGSDNFIINVSDEQGLEKLEIVINGEKYRLKLDGRKELEYKYPIRDGENKLEVTVYNQSNVTQTKKVKVTK